MYCGSKIGYGDQGTGNRNTPGTPLFSSAAPGVYRSRFPGPGSRVYWLHGGFTLFVRPYAMS